MNESAVEPNYILGIFWAHTNIHTEFEPELSVI